MVGEWSFSGQSVVSEWLASGQLVVSEWSVVVIEWSVSGQ